MIVSNTTPISNLLHVNKLSLLADLFGTLYIPDAVANELNVLFLSSREWQKCLEEERVIVQPISNTILAKQIVPLLHQGEAEVICLALEKKAKLCLMDDKDGRIIAQSNNLSITGTLGILLKAKKTGLISSVKPLIDNLRMEHHFWIRDDMYQKVLYIAEEKAS
jgi:predicted nucleic acid-binding protein